MTNLPKPAIKSGTVWFYGPDPVCHSALLVTDAGDRVTAYASAKEMELDYDPQDLITPDQLVAQAVSILTLKDGLYWESMVTGRLEALAAGVKLQGKREILLAVRLDQLCDMVKTRLAATASGQDQQPHVPVADCSANEAAAVA